MNEAQRITLTDSPLECVMKLAEGNPGAVTAIMKMMEQGPAIDPDSAWGQLGPLISLDTLGIYGSHVWLLWKDICGHSALKAETLFRSVQLGFLDWTTVRDAAKTGRHSFDFDELLAKVQDQLPAFGRTTVPA